MDKMRVILCDAAETEAEAYANLCRDVLARDYILMEVKAYGNSEELLFHMENTAFSTQVSVLIVDPDHGAAAVPAAVRQSGYDGLILYLSHSASVEHFQQAFDVGAFNYVQKGSDAAFEAVFIQALTAARQQPRQTIFVSRDGESRQIDVGSIDYFEAAADHMIRVAYAGGTFKFIDSLQNLESRLGDRGFVRAHRSFLVAVDAVRHLEYDELTLHDGQRIPVGRSYFARLKSTLGSWRLHKNTPDRKVGGVPFIYLKISRPQSSPA